MTSICKALIVILLITLSFPIQGQNNAMRNEERQRIRLAVEKQLETFPLSTLRDVYKSFFQDRFGPGHLLGNTDAAKRYLQRELTESKECRDIYYEATGSKGNFYRVDLAIIRKGLISFDDFFAAFVHSMEDLNLPPVEEWKKEWALILSVIADMEKKPNNYQQDCEEIDSLLDRGHYVMHHSRAYNQAYNPHYRIISKQIFEKEILPKIKQNE